jgi:hypothetical protein
MQRASQTITQACDRIQPIEKLSVVSAEQTVRGANPMAIEARHNWHLSKSWQTLSDCADAKTIRRPLGNGSVIALLLKSGTTSSLHDVSKKDLNVGLSENWFRSIIYTSK